NPDILQAARDEYHFVRRYKKPWENVPHPVTFVTVDAVVECMGHVLVVKRKAQPGKGQIGLPGGFINPSERIEDACIRELKEETKIKVPPAKLYNSIARFDVFDHPQRSLRGRTITHAYYIELDEPELPK